MKKQQIRPFLSAVSQNNPTKRCLGPDDYSDALRRSKTYKFSLSKQKRLRRPSKDGIRFSEKDKEHLLRTAINVP
jgi:hypothetical protein